jgi:hypothetical protein
LAKYTPESDVETIRILNDTKKKIEEVVEYVNEGKRVSENLQKIVEIQSCIMKGKARTNSRVL